MKIIFGLSTNMPFDGNIMGAERACLGMAHALHRRGHTVEVTNLLNDSPKPDGDVYHWVNAHGPKGIYATFSKFAKLLDAPVFCTPTWWPLTKGELGSFESLYPGSQEWKARRGIADISLAKAATEATLLLPNAKREGELFVNMVQGQGLKSPEFKVVPNAVSRTQIEATETPDWEQRSPTILSVGRVEPAKNQHNLAQAFRLFHRKHPESRLQLVGEIANPIINMLLEEFLQPGVNMTGWLRQEDALALMAQSRVYISLGLHETPSLATLEAAALGCQLVVAEPQYGTISEYLPDLITVDPLDPDSILDGLEEAWSKPPKTQIRNTILKNYTYDKIAGQLEKIYKQD